MGLINEDLKVTAKMYLEDGKQMRGMCRKVKLGQVRWDSGTENCVVEPMYGRSSKTDLLNLFLLLIVVSSIWLDALDSGPGHQIHSHLLKDA